MKLIEVHEYQVVVCFGWIIGRVVEWQGNSPLAESIRCRYLRLRVNAPNIYNYFCQRKIALLFISIFKYWPPCMHTT